MSDNVTEPTSINPGIKWISLAIAVVSVVVVLVATRLEYLQPLDSSTHTSSSSSATVLGLESLVSASRASKLCFTRGGWIYLKDLRTGTERKLVEGQWPDLSPDGSTIVFMSAGDTDAPNGWRMRALNLASLQVREFSSLVGRRILIPRWSNDGTKIAFVTIDSNASSTDIGVFDPSAGEWKNLTEKLKLGSLAGGIDFDSWVPGDQSVLFHSLENLYEVAVNGTLVSTIPIANLHISSSTRFSFSADKKQLLFDQTIDTAGEPLNAKVSVLNIDNGLVAKITPGTIEARAPRWLPSQTEIVFTCMKRFAKPSQPNICKIRVDGTGLMVIARNADIASFSVE